MEHRPGDEAELTTRIILDSKGQMTKIEIFHLWNGSFRPNLGDGDGGGFIVVLAGVMVQRMTVVRTFLGTDSAITVWVGR